MSSYIDEALLSINPSYNKPIVKEGKDSLTTLIIRLILLEPGTIQTHPNMGVGLVSRYRNSNETNISELRSDIKYQINTYLPMFTGVIVDVFMKDKQIIIQINSEQINTIIPFDTENQIILKDLIK